MNTPSLPNPYLGDAAAIVPLLPAYDLLCTDPARRLEAA